MCVSDLEVSNMCTVCVCFTAAISFKRGAGFYLALMRRIDFFDFYKLCDQGFKTDCKTSCLHH